MITDTVNPDPHAETLMVVRDTAAAADATSAPSDDSTCPDGNSGGRDRSPGSVTERSGTHRTIRRARRARTGAGGPPPVGAAPGAAVRGLLRDDGGMSTVEYAIGTVAAAAFAAILYAVVSGDTILGALTGIVQRALSTTF